MDEMKRLLDMILVRQSYLSDHLARIEERVSKLQNDVVITQQCCSELKTYVEEDLKEKFSDNETVALDEYRSFLASYGLKDVEKSEALHAFKVALCKFREIVD